MRGLPHKKLATPPKILSHLYVDNDLQLNSQYLTKNLNFENHIHQITKKANSMIGMIWRSFDFLDIHTFQLLYKAIIRPKPNTHSCVDPKFMETSGRSRKNPKAGNQNATAIKRTELRRQTKKTKFTNFVL